MISWQASTPIYQQLRERTVALILDGVLGPGEPLPSVRQAATDLQVNPMTVTKAYESLVNEGVVEKRRGLGLFVTPDAPDRLREAERQRFIHEEWPALRARLERLHLNPCQLWQAKEPS